MMCFDRKGPTRREAGAQSPRTSGEVAGLPGRQGNGRTREPGADLMGALGRMSLAPGETLDGDLAGMKPHLEEALGALGRLGQRRDLSETEKMRAEALRMLLASIERARR